MFYDLGCNVVKNFTLEVVLMKQARAGKGDKDDAGLPLLEGTTGSCCHVHVAHQVVVANLPISQSKCCRVFCAYLLVTAQLSC
jgi:hypothetical protein